MLFAVCVRDNVSDFFLFVIVHLYFRLELHLCYLFLIFVLFVSCYLIFFFFKQKTAYELRISDWSSDVCSSDLAPRAAPCCIGRGARHVVAERSGRFASNARRASLCRPGDRSGAALRHSRDLDLARDARRKPRQPARRVARRGDGSHADHAGNLEHADVTASPRERPVRRPRQHPRGRSLSARDVGRSEEHTSELQSLMRISY